MNSNFRNAASRLGALAIGIALALCAGEAVVRLTLSPHRTAVASSARLIPRWRHLLNSELYRYESDARLHFSLRPGFDFTFEDVRYRVNEWGMRGGIVRREPQPRRRRVMLLGDAVVFGLGVSEEESFAGRLASLLGSDRVEVLNAGIPAYHTGQEAAWLERIGFELEPDLIVLVFYGNDTTERAYHWDSDRRILYSDELPVPYAWKRRLWNSALYAALARAHSRRLDASGSMLPASSEQRPVVAARVRRLVSACSEREIPLVIVGVPYLKPSAVMLDSAAYAPYVADVARVRALAENAGVAWVDLVEPVFERARGPGVEPLLVSATGEDYDDHFNAVGCEFVAARIARTIIEADLLALR